MGSEPKLLSGHTVAQEGHIVATHDSSIQAALREAGRSLSKCELAEALHLSHHTLAYLLPDAVRRGVVGCRNRLPSATGGRAQLEYFVEDRPGERPR